MKHYLKAYIESELGGGVVYYEVCDDGWATRQIEVYRETWMWADERHPLSYVTVAGRSQEVVMGLADQRIVPIDSDDPAKETEPAELRDEAVSADEFEKAWQEALKRRPQPGRPVPRAQDINR